MREPVASGRVTARQVALCVAEEDKHTDDFYDDLSGLQLNPEMVRMARVENTQKLEKLTVCDKVSVQ